MAGFQSLLLTDDKDLAAQTYLKTASDHLDWAAGKMKTEPHVHQ